MKRLVACLLVVTSFGGCATQDFWPMSIAFDAVPKPPTEDCNKTEVLQVADVPVWQVEDDGSILFVSKMAVSADGAPDAYHLGDQGSDYRANAGSPGNWWAVVTDDGTRRGTPVVQGEESPFPGYYVSTTALFDPSYKRRDPRRYVDARSVPYFVLPMDRAVGAQLGDVGMVYNPHSCQLSPAIYADVGPTNAIGEGSIRLAENLGIASSPRTGGISDGIVFIVFPGSGNRRPMTALEIEALSTNLFEDWGGYARLQSCLVGTT
jgi:hypothetical protein